MTPFEADHRFHTMERRDLMVDSYTGYRWCNAGLHLLTPEKKDRQNRCLPCQARLTRSRRRRAR